MATIRRSCQPGDPSVRVPHPRGGRPPLYSPGVSQSTPSGGTAIVAEAGRPCQGSATASMPPRLPTPLPPYTAASVLITSRQRPASGRPTLYCRCGTAEKLAMHAITPDEPAGPSTAAAGEEGAADAAEAAAGNRMKDSTLPWASLASIQRNPSGDASSCHSAGCCL